MTENTASLEVTESTPTLFDKAKTWVIGLTGVLLVIPALINAGIDIYKVLLNIPSTESERINLELFKKHFQESPVTIVPVPIKAEGGNVTMQMSIYQNGDIYAEYGLQSAWFPMPRAQPLVPSSAQTQLPFISSSASRDFD